MLGPRTFAVRGPSAFVRTIVELIDDVDGKSKAEETVLFSLDGVEYRSTCRPRTPASSVARSSSGPAPLAKSAGPRGERPKPPRAQRPTSSGPPQFANGRRATATTCPATDESRDTIRRMIADGQLPAYRFRGQVRITVEDIDKAMRPIR
ncbi:helix-turn-helix domain-containing protein [Nocardia nova]|nr:helix-turn-helix domain-containing protein [Nocardia nova]